MGQALFDGNLKRKTFAKGKFYVVNQTDLGGQPYNIMTKFNNLSEAETSFKQIETQNDKYSKILVNGTNGKITQKFGPEN